MTQPFYDDLAPYYHHLYGDWKCAVKEQGNALGFAVFSVRDYDRIERKNPDVRPYGLRNDGETRLLAVQVWEWEGDQYDVRMYLTSASPAGECDTRVLKSRYYAVSIDRLVELLHEAGFADIQRRDRILFQPVIFWPPKFKPGALLSKTASAPRVAANGK